MTKDARSLGREYGKKVATFFVKPVPGQNIETDIRLKAEDGTFYIEWNNNWYSGTDVNDLKKEVQKAAAEAAHLDWDPYIEIDRQWDSSRGHHYHGDGPDVPAVQLDYRVIFLTRQKVKAPATKYRDGHEYRLYRKAEVDKETGKIEPRSYDKGENYTNWNKALVPYTPERLRTIEQIRDAIVAARHKLQDLCDGEGEKVGGLLDNFNGRLLGSADGES